MGSNMGKSSADLHKEADEATQPHISETINPRARLARQEADAGLSQTDTRRAAPAPAPAAGTMSQADFTQGRQRSTTPPADVLKKHQGR
jgi:hypothetical protein